ncbi:PREDICTED: cation/H(+) antiporter 28 [Tarenaya hassleriana]|uniref:cation/H(+) antiporter 28 n=1 Tax=Tarenaya hassleriana TaxID=28532 RepID=UPI00053C47F9|nr:PREDICTED: cation/H(+) antiporter 28 [Tarenaya hassleriana]XP_010523666.1 PREDICTED: cation/H(+) antiporter 28 [Tarenaya hassleriana]
MATACADNWFLNFDKPEEAWKFVGFIIIFVTRSVVHHLMKPQPYLTTDFAIGIVLGNLPKIREAFLGPYSITLNNIIEFGMICHMFVLGLEMRPSVLIRPPTKDALIAYSGMFTTFLLAILTTPFLRFTTSSAINFPLALSLMASGTASPVLTRLISNLKIRKSDIGKLATSAGVHTDMVSTLFYCLGFIILPTEKPPPQPLHRFFRLLLMISLLLAQATFTAIVSPIFLNWVNNENPEGKPLKGSHLVMSLAFIVLICTFPTWAPQSKYNPILSAFTAGLFLPNHGRMSKWIINKINYLLGTVFYPVFFFWVGFMTHMSDFAWRDKMVWVRAFSLLLTVIAGKVVGTVICGALLGYHVPETASLGLLLTAKGHFHVFLAALAIRTKSVTNTTGSVIILIIVITVGYSPYVVKDIIKRARKRVPVHIMALQWLDPTNELRVMIGLHGAHNIGSTINLMEICHGGREPGSVFYATDMVELTDEIAATIQRVNGASSLTVTDDSVTEMRDTITTAVNGYTELRSGQGVTVRRMLALSTFTTMAHDVCGLADELMVSIIILPFHKGRNTDGTLDSGHAGFRYVNRKILKNAPCSVGILVDRSFGQMEEAWRPGASMDVAIIFIGGRDDREALAFAARLARHSVVKLKVIRFLEDKSSQNPPKRSNILNRESAAEQEEEMKLDDECFAEFYERYIATGGRVTYMEKHLANSSETFTTLKSLDGEYGLVIVGRGGRRANSMLTVGLNDWQQCPELGPIGDVLSGSDFSHSTSVLIIQQQRTRGQLEGLHDDFSIM